MVWSNIFSEPSDEDAAFGVAESLDQAYIYYCGYTNGHGITSYLKDAMVGKVKSADGSKVWIKLYGGVG